MIKTDKIKVVVFSGGTGAASLLEGLKYFDVTGKAMQVTSIVNAYDDGKSTGQVRQVCNVLGPSDIRKNQWHQYRNKFSNTDNINRAIHELFNKRYDFTIGKEEEEILRLIDIWDFDEKYSKIFKESIKQYFALPGSKSFPYNDFNISNILYAMLFKEIGYRDTIRIFKGLLDIEDDVMLISEDNLILNAISKNKKHIDSEAEIVEWLNGTDPIDDIFFIDIHNNSTSFIAYEYLKNGNEIIPKITEYSKEAIEEADLIIFAPGTQWSSLIPTYITQGFDKLIQSSKAKKLLLMNNIQDKDNIGQTAGDILNSISKYLTLDNIDIFINNDTPDTLLKDVSKFKDNNRIFIGNLGIVGLLQLHDYHKTAFEVLKHYYDYHFTNLKFFDFDDTIYSRDPKHREISDINLDLLNEIGSYDGQRCVVTTGNDYDTIHKKLVKKYGSNLSDSVIHFDIFADGGIVKYYNGRVYYRDKEFLLQDVASLLNYFTLLGIPKEKIFLRGDWPKQDINNLTCIGIKPLTEIEKNLLVELLNIHFKHMNLPNVAKKIGLTGIDILNKETNKIKILGHYYLYIKQKNVGAKRLYIGDELEDGNDKEIAAECDYSYNVKSPYDTNILLSVILEDLQPKELSK